MTDREIKDLLKLRFLLSQGSSDPDAMFKKSEFRLTPQMLVDIIRHTNRGPEEADRLVRHHLTTSFVNLIMNDMEVKSQRDEIKNEIIYSTEAVVLRRSELYDIIRFCINNRLETCQSASEQDSQS